MAYASLDSGNKIEGVRGHTPPIGQRGQAKPAGKTHWLEARSSQYERYLRPGLTSGNAGRFSRHLVGAAAVTRMRCRSAEARAAPMMRLSARKIVTA